MCDDKWITDTQTGILPGISRKRQYAFKVFDDSLNSAIHITYRISLRSSSLREPRYPLLKVVYSINLKYTVALCQSQCYVKLKQYDCMMHHLVQILSSIDDFEYITTIYRRFSTDSS